MLAAKHTSKALSYRKVASCLFVTRRSLFRLFSSVGSLNIRCLFSSVGSSVPFVRERSGVQTSQGAWVHFAPQGVGSRSPDGWDQNPYRSGGWVLHQSPFGFDSQTRGNQTRTRETGPVLKYRVPQGSQENAERKCMIVLKYIFTSQDSPFQLYM